jgi:hypothetical protein
VVLVSIGLPSKHCYLDAQWYIANQCRSTDASASLLRLARSDDATRQIKILNKLFCLSDTLKAILHDPTFSQRPRAPRRKTNSLSPVGPAQTIGKLNVDLGWERDPPLHDDHMSGLQHSDIPYRGHADPLRGWPIYRRSGSGWFAGTHSQCCREYSARAADTQA